MYNSFKARTLSLGNRKYIEPTILISVLNSASLNNKSL
jgi:hypothetical protein